MQLSPREKEIVNGMRRYLKECDRNYIASNHLVEQTLEQLLVLIGRLGPEAYQLPRYMALLRRQSHLLNEETAFCAGKYSAQGNIPWKQGFFACLSGVFDSREARLLEKEIWKQYHRLGKAGGYRMTGEFTALCRDLYSRSGELMMEVFQAGYIAQLQEDKNGKSPLS